MARVDLMQGMGGAAAGVAHFMAQQIDINQAWILPMRRTQDFAGLAAAGAGYLMTTFNTMPELGQGLVDGGLAIAVVELWTALQSQGRAVPTSAPLAFLSAPSLRPVGTWIGQREGEEVPELGI